VGDYKWETDAGIQQVDATARKNVIEGQTYDQENARSTCPDDPDAAVLGSASLIIANSSAGAAAEAPSGFFH
jgi:hypothetical protein